MHKYAPPNNTCGHYCFLCSLKHFCTCVGGFVVCNSSHVLPHGVILDKHPQIFHWGNSYQKTCLLLYKQSEPLWRSDEKLTLPSLLHSHFNGAVKSSFDACARHVFAFKTTREKTGQRSLESFGLFFTWKSKKCTHI